MEALQVGQRVLAEAEVIKLKPAREGYVDVKIYDHYYYAEDGTELEDAENLRLPAHHIHPLPTGEGWQPIATAPKDGTQVLLWGKKQFGYGIAYWTDHNNGGWVSYWPFASYATHWQPLPPPPQQTEVTP